MCKQSFNYCTSNSVFSSKDSEKTIQELLDYLESILKSWSTIFPKWSGPDNTDCLLDLCDRIEGLKALI